MAIPFPVVAIGASAGGVEALNALLRGVPDETRLSCVVVQHLAPDRESFLARALAGATALPVSELGGQTQLQPGHVYVVPPGRDIVLRGGVLHLVDREPGRHMPVDLLFRSMAEDLGDLAIGVVLSGTGSDGTEGLEAIKAAGGLTIAQDPSTAGWDGMPRSAIDAGAADLVLPPERMVREILAHASQTEPEVAEREPRPEDEVTHRRIIELLSRTHQVDLDLYKQSTLRRRIARRAAMARLPGLRGYLERLREDPAELAALFGDLFIQVTSFFREPAMFAALAGVVFPEITRNKTADVPVRLWVPGCSSGEEAYSLTMALADHLGPDAAQAIRVFGSDISEPAIHRARTAVYPASIAADVGEERLRRYFTEADGGYRVSKQLRDLCVFVRHDVARDPPFSRIDLISCRNLLIYLGPVLQKRILPLLHYALVQPGYLVLGGSESLPAHANLFSLVDREHHIYVRTPGPRITAHLSRAHRPPDLFVPQARPTAEILRAELDIQRAADHLLLTRFAPAGVVVDENLDIVQYRGRTGQYLEPPPGHATLDLRRMAREGLAAPLSNALEEARRTGATARAERISFRHNGREEIVNLEVLPLRGPALSQSRHYLVLFEPVAVAPSAARESPAALEPRVDRELSDLRQELAATGAYLQSMVEQYAAANDELTAANEELQSSNEELQSTNEELETTKEELQSANEELVTVNAELQSRNQELDDANDDLVNFLASVNIPVVIVDADRRIRRFTPTAREVINLLPNDVGRRLGELRPNFDAPAFDEWVAAVIDSMQPAEHEVRDRQGRWQRLQIRPYRRSDHRIDGAVISLIDIDTLKSALLAARAARDRATAVLETVPVPIAIVDDALRIESTNPAFRELMPGAAVGTNLLDAGGEGWLASGLGPGLAAALQGAALPPMALSRIGEPGPRILEVATRVVPSEEGRRSLLVMFTDVTDRAAEDEERVRVRAQRAQQFLNEVGAMLLAGSLDLRSTLEHVARLALPELADWCIIDLVEDGTIRQAAAAHVDPEKEALARRLARRLALDVPGQGGVVEVVRTGKPVMHPAIEDDAWLAGKLGATDAEFLRELGARSYLCVPIPGRDQVLGALSLVRAKPPRRYSAAELGLAEGFAQRAGFAVQNALLYGSAQDAIATRDEFISVASHELRTPLTAMQVQAQGLQRLIEPREPSPEVLDTVSSRLDAVVNQIRHMTQLIDSLLVVSRINAGRFTVERQDADLALIVRDVVEGLAADARQARSEVRVEGETSVPGRWDPFRMEQVLTNLLTNAFRHAPGGPVVVRVSATEDTARLEVEDSGPGIPTGRRESIFERFVAGDARRGGLGLGLFIVREIVRNHGGWIRVESAPGQGARFIVELPRRETA